MVIIFYKPFNKVLNKNIIKWIKQQKLSYKKDVWQLLSKIYKYHLKIKLYLKLYLKIYL